MRRGLVPALAALALIAPAGAEALPPSTPDRTAFQTNGDVYSVARGNGVTYIGGDFSGLSAPTGPAAKLNGVTGARFSTFPVVTGGLGQVLASAPDGSGGYYIGGDFTAVGGVPRDNIAHVLSNGTVDPSFNPDSDGPVRALAVSGSAVYAGGFFTSIGGLTRQHVAKLSATSGNAFSGWHPSPNNEVNAIAVSSSGVYIGGQFSHINTVEHNGIARISPTSGNLFSAFNSTNDGSAGARVFALAATPSAIFVGGRFTEMGGLARDNIAKISATSGNAFSGWNPGAALTSDPDLEAVRALATDGTFVYAGGLFNTLAGQARNNIGKLLASNGDGVTTFDPDADQEVHALSLSDSTLFVGGSFSTIGGLPRNLVAKLSTTSGNAFSTFMPNPVGGFAATLSVSGTSVMAGGGFEAMNFVERNGIAALDGNGVPTAWNPNANSRVNAIVVDGSSVYVGGGFNSSDDVEPSIGGQPRDYIAKLSAASGNAFSGFNPGADNNVITVALSGSNLYAGGDFQNIGGQARPWLAKLSTGDGTVDLAFDAAPDADPTALVVSGDGQSLFAGGFFDNIGGQAEQGVSKLSAATGADDPVFDANATDNVRALALAGSGLYVGGDFSGANSIGGQARDHIARLSATNGNATGWNPDADGNVNSIAASGSLVHAGGDFTNIGSLIRNGLAVLSATSGDAFTAFNANLDAPVLALAFEGSTLYAGGGFTAVGGRPRRGYAQFTSP